MDLLLLAILGVPVLVGLAWWNRSAPVQAAVPQWRKAAFVIGLIAVSANAAIYYGWLGYRLLSGGSEFAWTIKGALADYVTIYLAALGLVLALIGQGVIRSRVFVALSAVLEVLLWSNIGV